MLAMIIVPSMFTKDMAAKLKELEKKKPPLSAEEKEQKDRLQHYKDTLPHEEEEKEDGLTP